MPDDSKSSQQAAENDSTERQPAPVRRRFINVRVIAFLVILAAIAMFGVREVKDRFAFVFEEDARVQADLITISSRVAGWITKMPIREGDALAAGSVIVQVDDRESQTSANELGAQLSGVTAQKNRLQSERRLVSIQIESRLVSERSRMQTAEVTVSALRPQLELARREFERTTKLFTDNVSSRRQLEQSESKLQQLDREYRVAVAEKGSANSRVAEADAEKARLDVLAADLQVLEQKANEIQARIDRQKLDILDRTVKSPISGVVDKTFVDSGEYVTPGQRLALIHDPTKVWIEANVKETEIRRLQLGQSVQVKVDAYPDVKFEGKLESIGNAATSQFALLPTPNPSGNFTKITQRMPVRIAIQQDNGRLKPGMMVEIKIAAER